MKINTNKILDNTKTALSTITYATKQRHLDLQPNQILKVLSKDEFDFWDYYSSIDNLPIKEIRLENNIYKQCIYFKDGLKVKFKSYKPYETETEYIYLYNKLTELISDKVKIKYIYKNDLLIEEINSEKGSIHYQYDNHNKLEKIIDIDNNVITSIKYNKSGHYYIKLVRELGFWIKYIYRKNNIVKIIDSLGREENYEYYKSKNTQKETELILTRFFDNKGNYIIYDYDFDNNLAKVFTNINYKRIPNTLQILK